jgi:hypothetical protein
MHAGCSTERTMAAAIPMHKSSVTHSTVIAFVSEIFSNRQMTPSTLRGWRRWAGLHCVAYRSETDHPLRSMRFTSPAPRRHREQRPEDREPDSRRMLWPHPGAAREAGLGGIRASAVMAEKTFCRRTLGSLPAIWRFRRSIFCNTRSTSNCRSYSWSPDSIRVRRR